MSPYILSRQPGVVVVAIVVRLRGNKVGVVNGPQPAGLLDCRVGLSTRASLDLA